MYRFCQCHVFRRNNIRQLTKQHSLNNNQQTNKMAQAIPITIIWMAVCLWNIRNSRVSFWWNMFLYYFSCFVSSSLLFCRFYFSAFGLFICSAKVWLVLTLSTHCFGSISNRICCHLYVASSQLLGFSLLPAISEIPKNNNDALYCMVECLCNRNL